MPVEGLGNAYNQPDLSSNQIKEENCNCKSSLSGIAATLLAHGRTLYSRCTVPLNSHETSMWNMSPQETTGVLFQKTDLLIIDEISMGHKHVFEP